MESDKMKSCSELKEFVNTHDLRDSRSIIQFNALVTIKTDNNELSNQEMVVMIGFGGYDNYGKITLLENYLDSNLYPTVFEAKWQKVEHKKNSLLSISGVYKGSSLIGKYKILIIPIRRLRD